MSADGDASAPDGSHFFLRVHCFPGAVAGSASFLGRSDGLQILSPIIRSPYYYGEQYVDGLFEALFTPFQRKFFTMPAQKKFHLVFSFVMGAMMIFIMTFVITMVNVGWGPNFLQTWAKAFVVAYVVGVPVIFFLAPVARRATGKLLGVPA